jgi:hypothetical protein
MNDFLELVNILDSKVKNQIKDGDYLKIMTILSKLYRDRLDLEIQVSDSEDDGEYGGQYC